MVINLEKGLTVEQGIRRIVELNKTLPYLPCFKHKESSPDGWTAQNKEFSEVEMCSHVLFAMRFKVQTRYYAIVEDGFPTCLDALTQRLGCVEANLRDQKKAYGDIVNRVLNSSSGGSGTKCLSGYEREAIPRKQKKKSSTGRNGSKIG